MAVVGVAGVVACASAGKSGGGACEPVPETRRAGLPQVYAECEVDVKAKRVDGPMNLQYSPTGNETCLAAAVDVVVDAAGSMVRGSAVIVRSTTPAFAAAVIAALQEQKFTPARKNGLAVPQVVRHEQSLAMRMVAIGRSSTQSTRRSMPARC